jgi:signal transduction histidine kinase
VRSPSRGDGSRRGLSLLPVALALAPGGLLLAAAALVPSLAAAPWLRHGLGAAWLVGAAIGVATGFAQAEERRGRERAEREANRRLGEAQRMEAVGTLAGGLAHDLNNVLAGVRAQCELVRDKAAKLPPERLVRSMDLVLDSVLRASSLLERLLPFARRQPVRPEALDLGEVVGELARVLRGTLPAGVELELDLAPGLWPVDADLAQLEQVVTNLFANAVDAQPGGGRVRLATANAAGAAPGGGDAVVLTVGDAGPGIPPEVRERIFEPFFTTREGAGRSGLGLAVVHGIVEQAGGRIAVETAPGAGTTFRVLLPRGGAAATAGGEAPAGCGQRVLLVDDEDTLRRGIADLLAAGGYRVTSAAGVAEALAATAAAGQAPFELVVTDVRLADGSGPDLVAALRRHGPLPALYMSGFTDRISLREGPGRGDAVFLKKPFSGQGLLRMVGELLRSPGPEPAARRAAGGIPGPVPPV